MKQLTVVPAYGRDYKTAADATEDWRAGKDFKIADVSSPYNGAYCSCRDPITPRIRFDRLRKVTVVEPE